MVTIDVRDKWAVANTDTRTIVQTCHGRRTANMAANTMNSHEKENARAPVYIVALNPKCEAFRELFQIAQDKGVDLSPLFAPLD